MAARAAIPPTAPSNRWIGDHDCSLVSRRTSSAVLSAAAVVNTVASRAVASSPSRCTARVNACNAVPVRSTLPLIRANFSSCPTSFAAN